LSLPGDSGFLNFFRALPCFGSIASWIDDEKSGDFPQRIPLLCFISLILLLLPDLARRLRTVATPLHICPDETKPAK